MKDHLRIVVADDEPDMIEYFQSILPRLGHEVLAVAKTGRELLERTIALHPDLVITDIRMPDMDGIEAASRIYQQGPVPVIIVSAHHDVESLRRAEMDHILAYLVKPIKQTDLAPAIALATSRFAQFETLRKEAQDLRQALEDRKVIERAKGILMDKAGLNEHDAFRRLQKLSRDENRKLVEVAHMIVMAEKALQPGGEDRDSGK